MLISADKENEIRDLIVAEAHKLLNVPFRHRGRTRFGLDCLGLCWLAYRRAGIDLPDGDGKVYEPNWYWFVDEERYLGNILRFFDFVEQPKKGDLITFNFYQKKLTHAGIVDANLNSFIHARSGRKVERGNLDERPVWEKKFRGYLVYKGFPK